jgi:hypothetical protein
MMMDNPIKAAAAVLLTECHTIEDKLAYLAQEFGPGSCYRKGWIVSLVADVLRKLSEVEWLKAEIERLKRDPNIFDMNELKALRLQRMELRQSIMGAYDLGFEEGRRVEREEMKRK